MQTWHATAARRGAPARRRRLSISNLISEPPTSAMLAIVASFSTGVPTATEWLQWKKEHNKVYASFEEEMARLEAWSTNADALKARKTGWERLNEFADQAPAEFNKRNGYRSELAQERINPVHKMSGTAPPPSVDWRTKGLVAEVKNQGQCTPSTRRRRSSRRRRDGVKSHGWARGDDREPRDWHASSAPRYLKLLITRARAVRRRSRPDLIL